MEPRIKEILEDAYEGTCDLVQGLLENSKVFGKVVIIILIYLTIPIWIIPYAIFKEISK